MRLVRISTFTAAIPSVNVTTRTNSSISSPEVDMEVDMEEKRAAERAAAEKTALLRRAVGSRGFDCRAGVPKASVLRSSTHSQGTPPTPP